MPALWTVKDEYTPRAEAGGTEPAVVEGRTFDFFHGDRLEIDESKTVIQEKDGVLIRHWVWLSKDVFAGYVPYNPDDPNDDFRSVAIALDPSIPEPEGVSLFLPEISVEEFAAACVRKAIRWNTNAAYLYALAVVESSDRWPAGAVTSPPAAAGQLAVGTYQFRPATWRTLVAKLGSDELINADHIVFPQPQATFAAAQSDDFTRQFEKDRDERPIYVDLYLAHLFTYDGAIKLLKASDANGGQIAIDVINDIFQPLGEERQAAILNDLRSRKEHLLGKQSAPTTITQLLDGCSNDIDRGFDTVRAVANSLIPPGDIKADQKTGSQIAGPDTLGILSEEFESRGNPAAIGRDRTGGFSYGKYQIASKKSFKSFMNYLQREFPAIKAVLEAAGGTAAARAGTANFKAAWRGLVSSPDFVPSQHGFIKETHYDVMVSKLKSTLDVEKQSNALQNVVWSVAVQHGPFSGLIKKVVTPANRSNPAALINAIYDERSKVNVHFRNSTAGVKKSVLNRFKKERKVALNMLSTEIA